MCDSRLRALYLKEMMAEVRAMLVEWWRQRDTTVSIPLARLAPPPADHRQTRQSQPE